MNKYKVLYYILTGVELVFVADGAMHICEDVEALANKVRTNRKEKKELKKKKEALTKEREDNLERFYETYFEK